MNLKEVVSIKMRHVLVHYPNFMFIDDLLDYKSRLVKVY